MTGHEAAKEQPVEPPVDVIAANRSLRQLSTEARGLSLEAYERDKPFVAGEVVPVLDDLLHRACSLLGELESLSAASVEKIAPVPSPRQLEEFSDVCFVLQSELRACVRQLGELSSSELEPIQLLIVLQQACDRLLNGLGALEVRLSGLAKVEPRPQKAELLQETLASRRMIAKFLSRLPDPISCDDESGFHRASTALAWLMGHDDLYTLRAEERLMSRQLQALLLEWSRGNSSPRRGQRIAHELRVFIELLKPRLSPWNLVEHDLRVVEEAIGQLSEGDNPHEPISCSAVVELDAVFGLDQELDRRLSEGRDRSSILARLIEIYERLAPLASPRASTPETDVPGRSKTEANRSGPPHLRLVQDRDTGQRP